MGQNRVRASPVNGNPLLSQCQRTFVKIINMAAEIIRFFFLDLEIIFIVSNNIDLCMSTANAFVYNFLFK